jgi:calcyphosin
VKLEDIAKLYNVDAHPEVVSGAKNPEQVFIEFMSLWDTQKRDAIITFDEFCDYYTDISASIEDDGYFVEMMKRAWKL